ncbi:TIR domain-containing protein [Janthinobacterium sp. OK676]|uniref:DnaB-like helicase C-terminal domain-containing protein n=1 Tax=Janthinobacterium sp. OK676 TaxID=1855295 RepID=UPI00087EAB9B|nr:DnaB-like helicase C-terminal domain-containing protein [Janthinobacterium sp. OK676]SDL40101.1 TIR domain-containing protein [Janthinobacterium sp. OK676]
MNTTNSKIRVFYSYSHKDETFREQLEEHLVLLRRTGLIQDWHDRKIVPGREWKNEIDENLLAADLILLLISSSFIASDYCTEKELSMAMSLHESGRARVVPIFIMPTVFNEAPFAGLQGLPKDAVSVSEWDNVDLAWQNVVIGLRKVLEEIREQKERVPDPVQMKTIREAMIEEVERIDAIYSKEEFPHTRGLPTGLIDLDRLMSGLGTEDLVVIASRPSMGKTSLTLQIAAELVCQDLPVLVFSLKSKASDISGRILAARAHIEYFHMGAGHIRDDDWPRLTAAIADFMERPLLIDDSPTLNFEDLRSKCINQKVALGKLALVVVDSLDYVEFYNYSSNIGRLLKSLARELGTTILVTVNLPITIESRPNKRPILADLKKPTDLADEADNVAFLYMDSHYHPDSPDIGTAELILAKNKRGPIGTVRLSYLTKYGTFENYIDIASRRTADIVKP